MNMETLSTREAGDLWNLFKNYPWAIRNKRKIRTDDYEHIFFEFGNSSKFALTFNSKSLEAEIEIEIVTDHGKKKTILRLSNDAYHFILLQVKASKEYYDPSGDDVLAIMKGKF